jgi:hypothetical protein
VFALLWGNGNDECVRASEGREKGSRICNELQKTITIKNEDSE